MGYDKRIVVFIDILGFAETVRSSNNQNEDFDRILTTLDRLRTFFVDGNVVQRSEQQAVLNEFNVDTQVIQVSDSLIISRKLTEFGGVAKMLRDCSYATHQLIDQGFLCRGAIQVGNVYHNGNTIFGTAYQDAYKAESAIALPIICFDPNLFEVARENPGIANISNSQFEYDFVTQHCKQLPTGKYYLDYFSNFGDEIADSNAMVTNHYLKLREIIVKGLQVSDLKVYLKNFWAAYQFNLNAEKYDLEKITL